MMNSIIFFLLMVGMMEGKNLIIKTSNNTYLAHLKNINNATTTTTSKHGKVGETEVSYMDYEWNHHEYDPPGAKFCGHCVGIHFRCLGGSVVVRHVDISRFSKYNTKELKRIKKRCNNKQSCKMWIPFNYDRDSKLGKAVFWTFSKSLF